MKSVINEGRVSAKEEYPCLKTSGSLVVLFTERTVGTVVAVSEGYYGSWMIGDYSDTWASESFKHFDGEVTLSN